MFLNHILNPKDKKAMESITKARPWSKRQILASFFILMLIGAASLLGFLFLLD
jgi:hypothetical protein